MTTDECENKLDGQKRIMKFIGIASVKLFKQLVEDRGFPAKKIFGRWYAHKENVDNWLKTATKEDAEGIPRKAQLKPPVK